MPTNEFERKEACYAGVAIASRVKGLYSDVGGGVLLWC